jgi:hypothetical protein
MAENKKSRTEGAPDGASAGQDQVDEQLAREQEQGYRGMKVDPTPDAAYTVAGVTAGMPTPETDAAQAAEAEAYAEQVGETLGAGEPDTVHGE